MITLSRHQTLNSQKERKAQLQQFIGTARTKQDSWTSRVQGGALFKKNQEASFMQLLPVRRLGFGVWA